jgi:hypothetical protein
MQLSPDEYADKLNAMLQTYRQAYINYHSNPGVQATYITFQEIDTQVVTVQSDIERAIRHMHDRVNEIQQELEAVSKQKHATNRRLVTVVDRSEESAENARLIRHDTKAEYWSAYRTNVEWFIGILALIKAFYL